MAVWEADDVNKMLAVHETRGGADVISGLEITKPQQLEGHEAVVAHNKISVPGKRSLRRTLPRVVPRALGPPGMLSVLAGGAFNVLSVPDSVKSISGSARAPDGVSRSGADQPARALLQSHSGPTDGLLPRKPLSPTPPPCIRCDDDENYRRDGDGDEIRGLAPRRTPRVTGQPAVLSSVIRETSLFLETLEGATEGEHMNITQVSWRRRDMRMLFLPMTVSVHSWESKHFSVFLEIFSIPRVIFRRRCGGRGEGFVILSY
ncbi:hypothetical protein E2C01_040197 [Portunus trituberculatus]|uniref:Uncharacterized protein n=1 Tax=Portunus trituberculatus TaxID=210409 RepID=A0A5B7FMC1_PORTR|nr:hypothetical protein [Portunus trituberculatus]